MRKTAIPFVDDPLPEVFYNVETLVEDMSKLDKYVFGMSREISVKPGGDCLLLVTGMGDNTVEYPLTKTGVGTLFKAAGMSWNSAGSIADIFGIDHILNEVNKMLPNMDTKYIVSGVYEGSIYRVAPTTTLVKPPSATVITDLLTDGLLGQLERAVRTVEGVQVNCTVDEIDLGDDKFFTGNAINYDPLKPNLALSPILVRATCKNVMQRKNVGWKRDMKFGVSDDQMREMIQELILKPMWDNDLLNVSLTHSKQIRMGDMHDSIGLMEDAKRKLGAYLWKDSELVEQIGARKNGKPIFDHNGQLSAFDYLDKYTSMVNQLLADKLVAAMKLGGQMLDAIVEDYKIMVSRQSREA